jgi:glutathione S-transferase
MRIFIGDKNLSSWSLRPWLVLKRSGAPFEESVIRLDRPETKQAILKVNPAGQVPALETDEGFTIWDSLAISEYLAERFPAAKLWPADAVQRALARAAAAEMHSGFASLRGECPMNIKRRTKTDVTPLTGTNLRRIAELIETLRGRYRERGPYLVGDWSIADAFYTPVATRIRTYGLKLSDYGDAGEAGRYIEILLEQPEFVEWEQAALEDPQAAA